MTMQDLTQRHAQLTRQRDVLAGRLEAAKTEREKFEAEMREYGAATIEELRVKATEADQAFAAAAAEAERLLDEAGKKLGGLV